MKQFYIALVWVMVCIVIPFMFTHDTYIGLKNFGKNECFYIISQFCFIAALCIPFDIRDLEKDKEEETNSIPVALGIKGSKLLAIALLFVYFVLSFYMDTANLVVVRGIILIIGTTVIWFSETHRHRYYYTYLADGIIIIQTVLLYNLL